MELQKGQKLKITDLTTADQLSISVSLRMKSGEADITCFGVDGAGTLSDDRYFVFYNQTSSPEGAISMQVGGDGTVFSIALSRLPNHIQKLVVTVAADAGGARDIQAGRISLRGGNASADYSFDGTAFAQEKALILCELYRKDGIWRYAVVVSGFNGGLSALLAHYGGQEIQPSPAPTPTPPPEPVPPPKINLSKINLKKSGDSHKIDLSKNDGALHVNLNWNNVQKKPSSGGAVDLDLACMYRLKDGKQGVIQALGNSFGSATKTPFILLDQDDRSGTSVNGENLYFKKPECIDFAVVFAFIYEGVPNWREANATMVLHQEGSPDIEIHIDNSKSRDRFCVLASLSGGTDALEVKREECFFPGHAQVDQHYHFGFRWVSGKK